MRSPLFAAGASTTRISKTAATTSVRTIRSGPQQIGKAGNHYINLSCANCHVRNGRALVADVGVNLDKWVFKVGDANGNPDPQIGRVLQPKQIGAGTSEGTVSLGPWTELPNGLRSPNYVFSNTAAGDAFLPALRRNWSGLGLLEAVSRNQPSSNGPTRIMLTPTVTAFTGRAALRDRSGNRRVSAGSFWLQGRQHPASSTRSPRRLIPTSA